MGIPTQAIASLSAAAAVCCGGNACAQTATSWTGTTDSSGATSGSNTWALSGTNNHTGATTISGGILSVATVTNGGVSGALGAASSDPANFIPAGGTFRYSGCT